MSAEQKAHLQLEPERYELAAPRTYFFDVDRRGFFKFLGAGVLVVCALKDEALSQESGRARRPDALPSEISAWLHLSEDGTVTVYTGKVEVGQNIRTSLTQAVSEELHVDTGKIKLVMGDTQLTPFDMGTFGSRTTPTMNLQLCKVAAAARDVLIGLAASKWKVDSKQLTAREGKVIDPRGNRTIDYAALIEGRQITEALPEQDPLIPAVEWKVAGTSTAKIGGRDYVTGKHRYPSDLTAPGMLHGKVLRPAAFGASLVSLDTSAAEKMPDVVVVHDGNFVGVAAPSVELATKAVESIKAEWKSDPQPSNKDLFDYLRKTAKEGNDPTGDASKYEVGSVDKVFAASQPIRQTYTVPYIAHVPLEPRAALARWDGDILNVSTGTQRPFGVRGELAEAFRIPEDHVQVLMPDTGSAYGGKHTGETAIEAARLARAAKRPVKVVWTREEEFTWAYFRPADVIDTAGFVGSDGKITAWEFHNYNSGSAGIRSFYDIANQRIQFHASQSPLRQGSYRALAATANHFARESFMDELATRRRLIRSNSDCAILKTNGSAQYSKPPLRSSAGNRQPYRDTALAWAAATRSWATSQLSRRLQSIRSQARLVSFVW
jgi:isoquinoline 1-oxidoreductase